MSIISSLEQLPGCDLDFISRLQSNDTCGSLKGKMRGTAFLVTYNHPEFIMLTTVQGPTKSWQYNTDLLRKACTDFLGVDAICSYVEGENPSRITFEWDAKEPEKRLRNVVNRGDELARKEIRDVRLFGGRKIADYESETEHRANADLEAARIRNARIHGSDPGQYDPEHIKQLAEWELFLEYYGVTLIAWRISHDGQRDHSRGHLSDAAWQSMQEDLIRLSYDIDFLLYTICQRIGVQVSEPEVDKRIMPDRDAFMKWYRFYDQHFMYQLSKAEWEDFEQKRKAGEDISHYLPTGDWHQFAG